MQLLDFRGNNLMDVDFEALSDVGDIIILHLR